MFSAFQPTPSLSPLLGDFDPDSCSDEEWDLAHDYILECILESEHDVDTASVTWEWLGIFYPQFERSLVDWAFPFPDPFSQPWIPVMDGHAGARALYERHYSARKNMARRRRRKTKLFVGPGEKLVLVTPQLDALFVWRQEKFQSSYQRGVNCAVFRNESRRLSSGLIRAAENFARLKWPAATRFYTFVDPKQVRSSNPGYCFTKADWRKIDHVTAGGLLVFEKRFIPAVAAMMLS